MSLKVHQKSLKGKRESNEDHHVVFLNADNRNPDYAAVNLYAVFDGHGGKFVSTFLKEKLHKRLVKKGLTYPLSETYIFNVYDKLQERLKKDHYKEASGTGSTCLVVIHYYKNKKSYLQVINTGDSRAMLFKDGKDTPISVDHKPGTKDEKARINEVNKFFKTKCKITWDGYDHRIKGLSVSRAFGDLDSTPQVTHRPQIYKLKLSDKLHKNPFMILACDGLWDVFGGVGKNSEKAGNFVSKFLNFKERKYNDSKKKEDIVEIKDGRLNIARAIAQEAISLGSTDNVTTIVVFFHVTSS